MAIMGLPRITVLERADPLFGTATSNFKVRDGWNVCTV